MESALCMNEITLDPKCMRSNRKWENGYAPERSIAWTMRS